MATASAIMQQFGLGLTDECVIAAQLEKCDIAVAATVLEVESGGRNIWGHDTSVTAGTYVPGGLVTPQNYLAYHKAMTAGQIPRNGAGPCQCTSAQYQDTADALGGCWDPVANMRSGFRGMTALINQFGSVQLGAQHYNGSGTAAVNYGIAFLNRYNVWKSRLAGASLQGDDMAAVPQNEWNDVHVQAVRAEQAWAGGYTDAQNSKYDEFEYTKRNNVEIHQCWLAVQALTAKVDALTAALAKIVKT